MKKSKDYIHGFKHGVMWALSYNRYKINEEDYLDTLESLKQAIKSLKEGR